VKRSEFARRVKLIPGGWAIAGYLLMGVALACFDKQTRQDVARENWASAQIETVTEDKDKDASDPR